jgi:lambda family phage portal protein
MTERKEPTLSWSRPPTVSRAAARIAAAPGVRRFMAARPDRLAGRFGFGPTYMREETRLALRGLINHARHGAQNVDYLRSYEMMVRRHVVGRRGITLQMDVRDPLGDRRDDAANDLIERAWRRWGRRGNCTVCGRLSWWNVENIAATMLAREGNFLLRTRTGRNRGPFGFQVQVLSVDLLDLDMAEDLSGGAYVEGGIEFNQDGRVLAFHMWSAHPLDGHAIRRERVRIAAEEIVHVYRPTEAMQALGVPMSHTALRRFNMLGNYEEAALAAAHFGAANMLMLESEIEPGEAPAGEAEGEIPEEIEAGATFTLPPGYKASAWRPQYPDGEMPEFAKHMLRGGASGLGVSYATLTSDMSGANFSSLRAGLGEERDEWRMFQRDLAEALHAEVFRRWLARAILSGEVPLPFSKLEKFQAATWRPRGWASVNPKDDAAANESDLRNGLRAPSDIVAERGEDFDEVVGRIKADLDTMRRAGLSLPAALTGGTPPASPRPGAPAEAGPDDGSTPKD